MMHVSGQKAAAIIVSLLLPIIAAGRATKQGQFVLLYNSTIFSRIGSSLLSQLTICPMHVYDWGHILVGSLAHSNRWDELVCLAGLSDELHGRRLHKHRGPRLAAIALQLLQPPLLPCLAVQLPMRTR